MVILFVTPFLRGKGESPKGGGLEAYLFRVAGALVRLGHKPIILSLGTRKQHYVEDNIEIFFVQYSDVKLKGKNLRLICKRLNQSIAVNRKVKELTRERNIDIIQFASIFGLATCYFDRTPAVMRLSGYAKTYYSGYQDFSRRQLYIWALFERLAARRCNAVFAPSEIIANAFSKDIHRAVSVIESPFWDDSKVHDNSLYKEKLSGKKYFLFIGRLDYEKGILQLAEILEAFLYTHQKYFFVCCGEKGTINGKNSLRILADAMGKDKARFIYMKPLPHETLYPIIQHADFVVFPSIMDNLSNACMEAMYFERVVIGTDGTSYEQLIEDGKSGLLCMPGNAKSLLGKMNEAAAMSVAEKFVMGIAARKRIDQLAPDIVVKKLLRFYQYIIINMRK